MKLIDKAKIKQWAANPHVISDNPPKNLPKFLPKKFNSHAEMNAWKKSLLREWARTATDRADNQLLREYKAFGMF